MAKDNAVVGAERTDAGIVAVVDIEKIEPPQPFVPPAPRQPNVPTAEQHAWMSKNPNYKRASHFFGRMINRGTLHADGSFISEDKHPMMDGPDCFGVGIPTG